MPVHNWKRVSAGIFHAFHHGWIEELARALNRGLLPADYYALPEQFGGGLSPDVLTLKGLTRDEAPDESRPAVPSTNSGGTILAPPKLKPTAETEMAFYRRKQKAITVRHVSGDDVVAMIEIVSPGNKAGRKPLQAFVDKAAWLLDQQVHLLIIDLFPPGKRDPGGIHGEIWQAIEGEDYELPPDRPLTLAAYEAEMAVRAYVVHVRVGDELPDMPLFLQLSKAVEVPLESTYRAAFAEVPRRWRRVIDPDAV